MNNDELATRRAQAIAEQVFLEGRFSDRCFTFQNELKPPGAEPVKWYKK